jgi:hypothetical protein
MAAGSRTWPNGLPALRTVPFSRSVKSAGAVPARRDRRAVPAQTGERASAGSRSARGRRARPGTLPRLPGACRAVVHHVRAGSDPARAAAGTGSHPYARSPACPPRTRAASAVSLARPGTAHTCKTQTPLGHRPAPCPGARAAASRGQDRRKPPPGTSQVYARYEKGPPQVHRTFRNSRMPLPLQHLLRAERVKKGLSNRISVVAGVAPWPGRGRAAPAARRQGGRRQRQGRPCV